ncbi:MAG TPA: hypothetical protein VLF90_03770 [Patescibacteria group bacterium]|nr:hypothetical protein [Patescibacteria group bacterium]
MASPENIDAKESAEKKERSTLHMIGLFALLLAGAALLFRHSSKHNRK